jgi:HEAT repeat protein
MDVEAALRELLEGGRTARDAARDALRRNRGWELARLAPVLAHRHVSRRIKAVEVLGWFPNRQAAELVTPVLFDPEWLVVDKAITALGRIGLPAMDPVADALAVAARRVSRCCAR